VPCLSREGERPPNRCKQAPAGLLQSLGQEPLPVHVTDMDPRFIDDLARRLSAAIPPGITAVRRDLEDNFKAVLQSALARLDLVSRQEFDVQVAVLRRTREKLEALEARLSESEKTGNSHSDSGNQG
jgi:ubiquinone biosynthesis accessory factor UbiK